MNMITTLKINWKYRDFKKNGGFKMNEIKTKRLLLRAFSMEDSEQVYHNWASQPDVYRFLPWNPHEHMDQTKQVIQQWIDNESLNQRYYWCIVLKEVQQCMGVVYFTDYNLITKTIEVGFCLGKEYWNKGYMAEALNASSECMLMDCKLEIDQIIGTCDIENPASGKAMEKAGYSFWKEELKYSMCKKKNVMTKFYSFKMKKCL